MTKKPGRPRKHGFQPIWMLMRATTAFYAYDEARRRGEKHSAAVQETVRRIQMEEVKIRTSENEEKKMPISETEVKRILAAWQPRNQTVGLIVSRPDPSDDKIILPGGRQVRRVLDCAYGLHPTYPRINARLKNS